MYDIHHQWYIDVAKLRLRWSTCKEIAKKETSKITFSKGHPRIAKQGPESVKSSMRRVPTVSEYVAKIVPA